MPDPAAAPTRAARPRSRLRRWLRRIAWTALITAVLFAVFHRFILRAALRHAAPWLAGSAGMKLSWDVDGSVVSGIDLTGITVDGEASSPLRTLKADRIRADYSLWNLVSRGPGEFVDEVVLENVTLDLDTTKFPRPDPNKPKSEPPPPPKVILPKVRLANVNARIVLPEGVVSISGLHFTMDRDRNGTLAFTELQLPGNLPVLRNVKGTTTASESQLSLTTLQLLPDVLIRSLALDLSKLHDRQIAVKGEVTVPGGTPANSRAAGAGNRRMLEGSGDIQFNATLGGLGREPVIAATVTAAGLTPETLQPWIVLPDNVDWHVPSISAKVDGVINAPHRLTAEWSLRTGRCAAGTVRADSIVLDGSLRDGVTSITAAEITAGTSRITATASARLPESWKAMAEIAADVNAEVNSADIADWFSTAPPAHGRLTGKLTAAVRSGKLDVARADLKGTAWSVQNAILDSLTVSAATDGRDLDVQKLEIRFDPENTVEAKAKLGLTGDRALTASWQIDLPNIERLAAWTGAPSAPGPNAGWLRGTGTVSARMADWQRQDFSRTEASMKLDGNGVTWKSGRMESVAINASAANGVATLEQFSAVLNNRNRLTASGTSQLAPPWAFKAKVDGDLSQLPDFKGWLEALGAPVPLSGKAKIEWEGSGQARDFEITGTTALSVEALRMPGMKDTAALTLKSTHSGRKAEIATLEASLGNIKISAPGTVTDRSVSLPSLKVTMGSLPAVEGRLNVPLDFTKRTGPAGPVDASGNLDVALTVKGLDFAEAGRVTGQKLPVTGRADASLTLTGSLTNPSADLNLTLQSVSSPDTKRQLSPADAKVSLKLRDRKLESSVEITQKPLQTLRASGTAPLDMDRVLRQPSSLRDLPVEATVTLPDSDLNALRPFVKDIASMKGTLGLSAKVSGPVSKPRITGELHAISPAIAFRQPDVPDARNVRLRLRFDGTRVYIEEAAAMLAGGTAGATGSVDWTDAGNPKIDATLTAREALVLRDDSISMRADGQVSCRGTLKQATVAGKVELVRGRVFKEIEFLPLSLPNQLPPAPPSVTVGRNAPPALPPPFDKWNFDVDIVTRDPVRLLGNVLNGGVVSDLHLRGTGAGPVLEGKVSLKDARVRLPFSRMTISRGDVVFTKDRPFQPQLDLQGDSFVNNYQVTLNAYGSALDPKIRFSSSPPLPEGEIATLLATGSTSGDLRTSEGEAANRAAFLLISQMYRKMFRKGALATESEEPPRLSFNFSLLNSSSGTGRSFSAIYEINSHLQAVGSMSQRGSFRGLLYYLIRFR